ncbi:hypothetical protein FNJ88_08215 [Chryseobacterium sp. SNU WT5]|uniref:glycosyltransferase n=1 Tax=Chryseobacterium sp. SNU WT5 TaxID=2594269 RepID=UPI00117E4A54|nr:glycosyltransferase [Chryseobacterium sp. SNU WT5]QDP85544.1 hypothetical protein FNJ88_08215 [Chryseobacterium sp. SNU WT5]
MLSIIISSYRPDYYFALEKNIAATCGIVYEIIKVENPGIMGICAAYNIGAEKAQYENLLFLHEDIEFVTENWGRILIDHLNQKNTGIIGVAGSSYVPVAPSSWTVTKKYNYFHILQGNKLNKEAFLIQNTPQKRNKVFAVDGVFLAVKKVVYAQFIFDEKNLTGFHGYDLDFSLRVSKRYQNYVINDILLQHFSEGNLDKIWFDNTTKVRQKLGSSFHKKKDSEVEKEVFVGFLHRYFEWNAVNLKNIIFTLQYYPIKYMDYKKNLSLLKNYYNYIRFSADLNKKQKFTRQKK